MLNYITAALLEPAVSGDMAGGGGPFATFLPIIMFAILGIVFYFFVYKPQKKQDKEINDMRNNLQVGDEITTTGGIIGKIVSMKEETLVLETSAERTKIRILKTAVRNVDVKAEDAK